MNFSYFLFVFLIFSLFFLFSLCSVLTFSINILFLKEKTNSEGAVLMNNPIQQYVFAHELQPLLKDSYESFLWFIHYIRTHYIMDEFWDGNKNKYKFKFRSKTFTDLSIKDGKFTVIVVYGKAERDKFIASRNQFSDYICSYFDTNKNYRDGKWMFVNITNIEQANDVIQMLSLKKKPNRILPESNAFDMETPVVCELCSFWKCNSVSHADRLYFLQMAEHCYGNLFMEPISLCDGFQSKAGCPIRNEIIRMTDTILSSRRNYENIHM